MLDSRIHNVIYIACKLLPFLVDVTQLPAVVQFTMIGSQQLTNYMHLKFTNNHFSA
jgi:hypothetical protein